MLVQSQKMDAVGQLTGGVAHDFNNILTVILGNIEILAEAVAGKSQLATTAKMIEDVAERGAELTQQLVAFARKQPLQPVPTDVNGLIANAQKLLNARSASRLKSKRCLNPIPPRFWSTPPN